MQISKELFAAHDLNKNGLLEVGIRIRDHPGLFLKDSRGPSITHHFSAGSSIMATDHNVIYPFEEQKSRVKLALSIMSGVGVDPVEQEDCSAMR